MKKLNAFILGFLLVMLSGCGASVRVFTDVDDSAAFNSYTTYNFLDFTEGNKNTITGMELERIRVAFARELERHGLDFVEDNSDVSVKITVYHRQAMGGYYYSPWRYNYMERAIAVDIYDNKTRKQVWHGAAVGELDHNPERRADRFPEIAAEIFQKYPVQLTGQI